VDDLHLTGLAGVASRDVTSRERKMEEVAVVGLDLAKTVFQVHGVGAGGAVVVRRQLRRAQVLSFFEGLSPCVVGIEA
jgi:transposase